MPQKALEEAQKRAAQRPQDRIELPRRRGGRAAKKNATDQLKQAAVEKAVEHAPRVIARMLRSYAPRLASSIRGLSAAALPVSSILTLIDGLEAIGEASRAGARLATRTNFATAFLKTLFVALGNPKMSPAEARNWTLSRPSFKSRLKLLKAGKFPGINSKECFRKDQDSWIKAIKDGARAAEVMLSTMKGSRQELLAALRRKYGSDVFNKLLRSTIYA